jgi:GTP-binding protein
MIPDLAEHTGPRVAIVGRPNVGKSTLFNRMAGKRLAIVEDQPGVTRDWQEVPVSFWGSSFILMDTPGLDQQAKGLGHKIWEHTTDALGPADIFVMVVDARAGLLPEDWALAEWVRKTGRPTLLLANKCESRQGDEGFWEAYRLGLGEPVPISAVHGDGMADVAACLEKLFTKIQAEDTPLPPGVDVPKQPPETPDTAEAEEASQTSEAFPSLPLKMSIVGRPNVGKSTFLHGLLGRERMLTGPEAGLTRDAVEIPWQFQDRSLLLVDTAGLRKAARIDDGLEKKAVGDTLHTIKRSQAVVLLMDAAHAFEKQDCAIASLVVSEGRMLILGLNKWDQVPNPQERLKELQEQAQKTLPQIKGVPLVPLSALNNRGFDSLMHTLLRLEKIWRTRISTGPLNLFLEGALQTHQPPLIKGRRIKLKYMTQIKTGPPTFLLFGNQTQALDQSYQNYLLNGLREKFQLQGVPLRLLLRSAKNPFKKD